MRRSLLVTMALAAFLGCKQGGGSSKDESSQAKTDIELIQGEWAFESVLEDGEEVPPEELKGGKLVVTGSKFIVKNPKASKDDDNEYKIDATKNPKEIDIVSTMTIETKTASGSVTTEKKTTQSKGVYTLEGDTLKICFGKDDKDPRPTELSSKKGSKMALITLKRVP